MPIIWPVVNKFWRNLVIATATFLPVSNIVPVLIEEPQACAENIPEVEKGVADLALESWRKIKTPIEEKQNINEMADIDILWNNLQAVFHVSDDTMIEDIEQIRVYVAQEGAKNPDIPPRIIHGALYTGAVLAEKLNLEIDKNKQKLEVLNSKLSTTSEDEKHEELKTEPNSLILNLLVLIQW